MVGRWGVIPPSLFWWWSGLATYENHSQCSTYADLAINYASPPFYAALQPTGGGTKP